MHVFLFVAIQTEEPINKRFIKHYLRSTEIRPLFNVYQIFPLTKFPNSSRNRGYKDNRYFHLPLSSTKVRKQKFRLP